MAEPITPQFAARVLCVAEETCLNIASYGGTPQERAASVIADSYCWIRPRDPAERIAHHRGIAAVAQRILKMMDAERLRHGL